MTQPLALLVYEGILPGSQLINHLRELGYRVVSANPPAAVVPLAIQERPMVILLDLVCKSMDITGQITALKAEPTTAHIPIIAFAPADRADLQAAAKSAGCTLVAVSDGILEQLSALLSQVIDQP
jgi:CheY-like chemotaxis protein